MMSPSAAPDLADQFHQFRHLNALQRAHRSLNVRAQALFSAAAHKPFEFGGYLVPRERPRRKPGVTVHLMAVRLATLEPDDDPAWHLTGVAGSEAVVWPDLDLFEQGLDVLRLCHGNERRRGRGQGPARAHAAATAFCHCVAASALKIRSVDRETR